MNLIVWVFRLKIKRPENLQEIGQLGNNFLKFAIVFPLNLNNLKIPKENTFVGEILWRLKQIIPLSLKAWRPDKFGFDLHLFCEKKKCPGVF